MLIYLHKERELADVEAQFPADHYVMVDDKLRNSLRHQENLGFAGDDRFRAAGTLCSGFENVGV